MDGFESVSTHKFFRAVNIFLRYVDHLYQVLEAGDHDMGFDAANECMVNLIEKGIIDPTKVILSLS